MLFVIEILFLAAGVWAVIKGEVPAQLFSLLFGKGVYALPPTQARLFGLLLASPWPVTFGVSFVLAALFGTEGLVYSFPFEIIYDIVILGAAVVVARKIRRPVPSVTGSPTPAPAAARKVNSYGARLLILLGMVFLGFITLVSACSLVTLALSTLAAAGTSTGNFWSDVLLSLLIVLLVAVGAWGTFRLFKLLRA